MPHDMPPHAEPAEAAPSARPTTPPLPAARRAGFSADELSAAARVIAHQVKLATAGRTPTPP